LAIVCEFDALAGSWEIEILNELNTALVLFIAFEGFFLFV
jgi:hypothetical protein